MTQQLNNQTMCANTKFNLLKYEYKVGSKICM